MPRTKLVKHILKLHIPIWDENIEVCFTYDLVKVWKKYEPKEQSVGECKGVFIVTDESKVIIIYQLPVTINTIIHEISHAVDEVLIERGLNLNEDSSSEAKAYLMGFISEKILEFYNTLEL